MNYFLKCILKLLTTLIPLSLSAQETVEMNGISYYIHPDGRAIVKSCSNDVVGSIEIKESIFHDGRSLSVSEIGQSAFFQCDKISDVKLPESILKINDRAFAYCTNLESISIPNSVTKIGSYAFQACRSLKIATLGTAVESIGDFAFSSCEKLTEIVVPNSVINIGNNVFSLCYELKSTILSNTLTTMGEAVFYGCKNLSSVNIPDSLSSVSKDTFGNCKSLTEIIIPNSISTIGDGAFARSGLLSITLPNTITSIGYQAFCECENLENIIIPNAVIYIGKLAFFGCTSLKYIKIPASLTFIGENAFQECNNLTEVDIMDIESWCNIEFENINNQYYSNPLRIATTLYVKGERISSLIIPNGVVSIPKDAFYNCSNIEILTIPQSTTEIGNFAFGSCDALKEVACYNPEPPICGDYTFTTPNSMILKVPFGTQKKYETAPVWKKFNIQEMSDAGTEDISVEEVCIEVARYDVNGRNVDANYKGFVIIRYSDGSTTKAMSK